MNLGCLEIKEKENWRCRKARVGYCHFLVSVSIENSDSISRQSGWNVGTEVDLAGHFWVVTEPFGSVSRHGPLCRHGPQAAGGSWVMTGFDVATQFG